MPSTSLKRYSLLDLAPVPEGGTPADALRNTLDLARHAEAAGFHRYWLAEHHNMPGIASAATSIMIGQVAAATSTIRVGAGGIMLPNHAPLVVAEQFGTLATLFPGRIDLGLGRAPGTDMATARALRRHMLSEDDFPQEVLELIAYLDDPDEGTRVRAIPGSGTHVPVWILGSSLYGAQLAAHFGLPYAFASHFAPAALDEALAVYRRGFRPSAWCEAPRTIVAAGVCAAETDAEARFLRSSQILFTTRLRSGHPGPVPRPAEDAEAQIPAHLKAHIAEALSFSATGSPVTIRDRLAQMLERTQADEIMITAMIHDHAARVRSFQIAAEVLKDLREG